MRRFKVLGGVAALLVAGAVVAGVDVARDERTGRDTGLASQLGASAGGVNNSLSGAADRATGGEALPAPSIDDQANLDAAAGGGTAGAGPAAVVPGGARVVKTATLTVSVDKASSVTRAAQRANTIAERHGGFVASSEAHSGDHASSTLTLRVPASAYDAALTELRALGEVTGERLGGQDVSATLVDLEARLRSLSAQESALHALLAKATTVGETLQVAQAVAGVRTQIEQLTAQQKNLADQADFATITLEVVGSEGVVGHASASDPVLVDALRQAAGGTLAVLSGAILVVGYGLPAAVLVAVGYGLWRVARRRVVTA